MAEFHRQFVNPNQLPPQITEKWSHSVLTEGFVPVPKKLVRCLHLLFPDVDSIKEIAVLLAVVDFRRPNLTRAPSLAYLSFLAGIEENEFNAALNRLQEKGYVRVNGNSEALEISLGGLLNLIQKETT